MNRITKCDIKSYSSLSDYMVNRIVKNLQVLFIGRGVGNFYDTGDVIQSIEKILVEPRTTLINRERLKSLLLWLKRIYHPPEVIDLSGLSIEELTERGEKLKAEIKAQEEKAGDIEKEYLKLQKETEKALQGFIPRSNGRNKRIIQSLKPLEQTHGKIHIDFIVIPEGMELQEQTKEVYKSSLKKYGINIIPVVLRKINNDDLYEPIHGIYWCVAAQEIGIDQLWALTLPDEKNKDIKEDMKLLMQFGSDEGARRCNTNVINFTKKPS